MSTERVTCPRCNGAGEVTVEVECKASVMIAHETFECYDERADHYPETPHWTIRNTDPCPNCGGYDMHSEACTTPEHVSHNCDRYEWRA